MHVVQGATEATSSEVASVRGQVAEKVQSYISQTDARLSCAVGEATQQLEKEVEIAAMNAAVTSSHNTQALVGTVMDEL